MLKIDPPKQKPDVTVAKDGSGDFQTINDALAKLPQNHQGRYHKLHCFTHYTSLILTFIWDSFPIYPSILVFLTINNFVIIMFIQVCHFYQGGGIR